MRSWLKSLIFGIVLFLIIYFLVIFFGEENFFSLDSFFWSFYLSFPLTISLYFGFREFEKKDTEKVVFKMALSSALASILVSILILIGFYIGNTANIANHFLFAIVIWPIVFIGDALMFAILGIIFSGIFLLIKNRQV
jgi:hypothetical protein